MRWIIVITGILTYFIGNSQQADIGERQLYYGSLLAAKESFKNALLQEPQNGGAWFGLVKTYFLLKQPDKANDTLLNAPPSARESPFFRIAEGLSFMHKNGKDATIAYFDNILNETKKKNDKIVAAIAWVQTNSPDGNANYAVDMLTKTLRKSKHNPQLYVLLGDAWRKLANGTEAFKAYQNAINEDKNYAEAYYKLGQIFLSQKNKDVYTDYFQKAVAADPAYSPAWYRLYLYEFNRNPAKAMEYYSNYLQNTDHTIQTEYDIADLLYLNGKYDQAIKKSNLIINSQQNQTQPRIYKLIAYSLAGKRDTAAALQSMQKYLSAEQDSNIIAKDYEAMSDYYSSTPGQDSLAAVYLAKATILEKDSTLLYADYKKLANMAKERKDYQSQAKWLEKYCESNARASNLDYFYWGIANYRTENYPKADSVFGIYIEKYPDQSFGYYWQAKSKALQDTSMSTGLAIPVYEKLIEILNNNTNDENYKKWIIEAYGYLAAYAVNTKKDYSQAIGFFQKILAIEPENTMAKKYIDMLDKRMKKSADAQTETASKTNSE